VRETLSTTVLVWGWHSDRQRVWVAAVVVDCQCGHRRRLRRTVASDGRQVWTLGRQSGEGAMDPRWSDVVWRRRPGVVLRHTDTQSFNHNSPTSTTRVSILL
jgi:hypothetical protein